MNITIGPIVLVSGIRKRSNIEVEGLVTTPFVVQRRMSYFARQLEYQFFAVARAC